MFFRDIAHLFVNIASFLKMSPEDIPVGAPQDIRYPLAHERLPNKMLRVTVVFNDHVFFTLPAFEFETKYRHSGIVH
jgi:hypothetical protein